MSFTELGSAEAPEQSDNGAIAEMVRQQAVRRLKRGELMVLRLEAETNKRVGVLF